MKKILSLLIFSTFIFEITVCQKIVDNGYLPDIDEPFQFNKELVKNNYRILNTYECPDSIFSKSKCVCKKKETFNDSGRLIILVVGNDIDNYKINSISNYISVTDSICQVTTEYFAHYVDSISDFKKYDASKKKTIFIYPRDAKTKNIKVKSTLVYSERNDMPDTIFRYDVTDKLQEIYYPYGHLKSLKEWQDSVIDRDSKTLYFHTIFPTHQYNSYSIYSKKGLVLEQGWTNISHDSSRSFQRTIYVYNRNSKVMLKNTVDEKNKFIESERFFYDSGTLIKHTIDRNPDDSVDNEIRIYNKNGYLLEEYERDASYPYNNWQWLYHYQGNLRYRVDYFNRGEYRGSGFFIYCAL